MAWVCLEDHPVDPLMPPTLAEGLRCRYTKSVVLSVEAPRSRLASSNLSTGSLISYVQFVARMELTVVDHPA